MPAVVSFCSLKHSTLGTDAEMWEADFITGLYTPRSTKLAKISNEIIKLVTLFWGRLFWSGLGLKHFCKWPHLLLTLGEGALGGYLTF